MRLRRFARGDPAEVDRIPCTEWARTILDLAATRPRPVVAKALDRAETLRIFDLAELESAMAAAGRRAGVRGLLREVLAEYHLGSGRTESPPEDAFLEICKHQGLPRPLCNFWMEIAGKWVRHDFWWPEQRASVEIDGYGTHATRRGFRADRRRDRNLILNTDIALLRFDAWEIKHDQASVARDVGALLGQRAKRV